MKIVIVTPILAKSAVARSTGLVIECLKKLGHSIEIIRCEDQKEFNAKIQAFGENAKNWDNKKEVLSLIENCDIIIYQLGDSSYHVGAVDLMLNYPGIVILHDYFLTGLFIAYMRKTDRTIADMRSVVACWYEENSAKKFKQSLLDDNENFWSVASEEFPMTEWAVSNALGVITHSHVKINTILKVANGPVAVLPLPYNKTEVSDKNTTIAENLTPQKVIITFGMINPNKRVESVINAIGSAKALKKNWLYRIIGYIQPEYKKKLMVLAKELQVQIEFTGHVSDSQLAKEITEADLVACLRFPTLESSSASTIEAMLHGKPVLVTNIGFYSQLPDETVIKISINSEIKEIQRILSKFEKNAADFNTIGWNAKNWASKTFDANSYAINLIKVIEKTLNTAPINLMAQNIGKHLLNWQVSSDSPILNYITNPIKILAEN